MGVKAGYSTPMLHVMNIEKSIEFYERLGFVKIDTDGETPFGWARMHCEGGAIMFLRAEQPVDGASQAFLLYMYTPDLPGLRAQLVENGVKVPEITYPPYMKSGTMNFLDPDGYRIEIAHWGKAEQEAWEKHLGGRPQVW